MVLLLLAQPTQFLIQGFLKLGGELHSLSIFNEKFQEADRQVSIPIASIPNHPRRSSQEIGIPNLDLGFVTQEQLDD